MLTQQFWSIFGIEYLCNDWFWYKQIIFLNFFPLMEYLCLKQPYWHTNKRWEFPKCPNSIFHLQGKSFICTKVQAFTTFSGIFTCIRGTKSSGSYFECLQVASGNHQWGEFSIISQVKQGVQPATFGVFPALNLPLANPYTLQLCQRPLYRWVLRTESLLEANKQQWSSLC